MCKVSNREDQLEKFVKQKLQHLLNIGGLIIFIAGKQGFNVVE